MTARSKSDDFLRAMNPEPVVAPEPDRPPASRLSAAKEPPAEPAKRGGSEAFGGYFDRETVEKVAVLRARLALDNSG